MRLFLLALACAIGTLVDGQTVVSDRAAKDAVHRIVRHSGLPPNFTVREEPGVRTAIAYIKDKQRVIAYNPAFIARIVDSSATDWSAVSVLAHEVGHHLMGHTLDPDAVHPGDELSCDRYSGFILAAMGVSLQESRAAMEVAGDPHGTERHPPRHGRLAAIEQGWNEWHRLRNATAPGSFTLQVSLHYVVTFHGDDNTYYVDASGVLLVDTALGLEVMAEDVGLDFQFIKVADLQKHRSVGHAQFIRLHAPSTTPSTGLVIRRVHGRVRPV